MSAWIQQDKFEYTLIVCSLTWGFVESFFSTFLHFHYWAAITCWLRDVRLISDKTKINYILFPNGQVFFLGIRLTRLTIPRSLNSFKGEVFSFLSVFSAQYDFGIWVSSISHIMWLHSPTKKWQLFSFRSLKNYHVLAFWQFIPQY